MSKTTPATLYAFAGLPGVGKTTLAKRLAASVNACFIRIDTVEQALRDLCDFDAEGEGYRLSYRIAADNLLNDVSVVADSCNTIALTRREWEAVAADAGSRCVNIEVVCSDRQEHKARIESRTSDIVDLYLPTWADVEAREYEAWTEERLIIDTAGRTEDEAFARLDRCLAVKR